MNTTNCKIVQCKLKQMNALQHKGDSWLFMLVNEWKRARGIRFNVYAIRLNIHDTLHIAYISFLISVVTIWHTVNGQP